MKRFSKTMDCFLLVFSISLISCSITKPGIKNEYTLTLNKPITLVPGSTLTLVTVSDSRCPINTNCIWAGNVTTEVKWSANGSEETINLCLGSCNSVLEKKTFSFKGTTYLVKLMEVYPFPGTLPPNATYNITAKLNISQQ